MPKQRTYQQECDLLRRADLLPREIEYLRNLERQASSGMTVGQEVREKIMNNCGAYLEAGEGVPNSPHASALIRRIWKILARRADERNPAT